MKKRWAMWGALLTCAAILAMLGVEASQQGGPGIRFRDAGKRPGLKGITVCGRQRKTSIVEVNGSGLCWLDYNNDGLLDLYVVNGGTMEDLEAEKRGGRGAHHNYLYRNNGDGTFTDVTEQAGAGGFRWGSGCAAADF